MDSIEDGLELVMIALLFMVAVITVPLWLPLWLLGKARDNL